MLLLPVVVAVDATAAVAAVVAAADAEAVVGCMLC